MKIQNASWQGKESAYFFITKNNCSKEFFCNSLDQDGSVSEVRKVNLLFRLGIARKCRERGALSLSFREVKVIKVSSIVRRLCQGEYA